jgi:RNA polymerase sigma-70 factor (ECF subfamily)
MRSADEDIGQQEQLALQRAFHQGDRRAFEQLVAPYLDDVYTLCLRLTRNPVEAEDLAQEALLKALRSHRLYNPERPLRPWLLTVAGNLSRSRLRSTWWRKVVPFAQERQTDHTPETEAGGLDRDAKVRQALATLPDIYREAVAVFHLEDLSYNEMAEITGVSVPALKQRVRRGTLLLRAAVERMYPDLDLARKADANEP